MTPQFWRSLIEADRRLTEAVTRKLTVDFYQLWNCLPLRYVALAILLLASLVYFVSSGLLLFFKMYDDFAHLLQLAAINGMALMGMYVSSGNMVKSIKGKRKS